MKRSTFGVVVGLIAALAAQGARADQGLTGADVAKICTSSVEMDRAECEGLVRGYIEGARAAAAFWFADRSVAKAIVGCIPEDTPYGAIALTAGRFLGETRFMDEEPAEAAIRVALSIAYECTEEQIQAIVDKFAAWMTEDKFEAWMKANLGESQ